MTEARETVRRRRWPWVLLGVLLLLAVLVVAAEILARSLLPGIVRDVVIEKLDLPADQQLDVDAAGLLLPQLLAGRLDELRIATDDVALGTLDGAADVTLTGVPLHGGDLGAATGTLTLAPDQFTPLLAAASVPLDTVSLAAPDASFSGTVDVLGFSLPVTVTVTPTIDDGDLLLTPTSLTLGGIVLTAEELSSRLGGLGIDLAAAHRVCLAARLPAGIALTDLTVRENDVVVAFRVNGAIASDPALQRIGTC